MEYVIKGREPEAFFRYFEEISAIPRESYHEEGIADYLVSFAKARGLEYYRDAMHNVLIKMPASKGWEDRRTILFQGHTDMICEKNIGVEHDFLREPLELWVDGNLLRARGTTLGADDGVAVATMLALLDGEVKEHPAYECLFTACEEPGLVGALAFDYSRISAKTLINIDGGNPNIVLCSCAGGVCTDLTLPFHTEPSVGEALRVSIRGLVGGHSGGNINSGRANANKLMGRLLAAVSPIGDVRLVSVNGGAKNNAITRECDAVLSVPNAQKAIGILNDVADAIAKELGKDDHAFSVSVEPIASTETVMTQKDSARVIAALATVPNGVFSMNQQLKYLVEYSRNLGVVRTEDGKVVFGFYTRSAKDSHLDASCRELDTLAAVMGGDAKHYSRYPGWEFATESPLREAYLCVYRETFEGEAKAVGVHAGLECGIICSSVPNMDAISIGPTKYNIHSPDEALDLDSCEKFWKVLKRLIEIY